MLQLSVQPSSTWCWGASPYSAIRRMPSSPYPGPGKPAFSKPQILMNFALHLYSTACSPDADEGYARAPSCSTRRVRKAPRSEQFSAGGKQTRPRKGGFCGAAIVIFALRASSAPCFRSDKNGGCAFEREMGGVKATEIRLRFAGSSRSRPSRALHTQGRRTCRACTPRTRSELAGCAAA